MIQKIKTFFRILLIGHEHSQQKAKIRPAIKNQFLNVKKIWSNKYYNDFGLERLIRLILALAMFIFPGLYIRSFFGKYGLLSRKIGIELYTVFKLFLPIIFFSLDWTDNLFVAIFSGIMAIETVLYLMALIYLSNEFAKPISYRRSLTTIFINYIEICLDYAVVYSYCNFTIPYFFKEKLTSDIQAIYFSFATSATVGYGDIVTTNAFGQCLVISQIILFLVFIGLFINFFASKVHISTYYNSKNKYIDKWQNHRTRR